MRSRGTPATTRFGYLVNGTLDCPGIIGATITDGAPITNIDDHGRLLRRGNLPGQAKK